MAAYVGLNQAKTNYSTFVNESQNKTKEAADQSKTQDVAAKALAANASPQVQCTPLASNIDLKVALSVLVKLTSVKAAAISAIQFSDQYKAQNPLMTAIKILHKTALDGTDDQKKELFAYRKRIISLNTLLKDGKINGLAKERLGIQINQDSHSFKGIQIALPFTTCDNVTRGLTWLPRVLITGVGDVALLPAAGGLLAAAACGVEFNPRDEDVKKGKIPILLIHGSGFNESEWALGRQFLKKDEYGSVFSLNVDGLVSNDPKKGIEDYAKDKVSKEIKRIKALTGSDRVILMGHSMGGLIAGCYAEYFAKNDQIIVDDVISISSPWQGSPTIDTCGVGKKNKRHQQMSVKGGTAIDPNFRQKLVSSALESERKGLRKYYNIWSRTDYAVPFNSGSLSEDPRRQYSFGYLGHYGIIAWPGVWTQIRSWLDDIYKAKPAANAVTIGAAPVPAATTATATSSQPSIVHPYDAKDWKSNG